VDKEGLLLVTMRRLPKSVNYMSSHNILLFLVDPLLVFEMIHRIIDILVDYLGDVSEVSIRDNFVIVYQVREDVILIIGSQLSTGVAKLCL
jgi:hypothetical protein